MSRELPYFQFEPAEWMMGRIQRCSNNVKGAYIDLCSRYWGNLCVMTLEDAQLDCGEDEVNELIKRKIIRQNGEMISISFLDSQFESLEEKSKKASKAGRASAEARRKKKEQALKDAEQDSTTVQQTFNDRSTDVDTTFNTTSTEEIRRDKKKEEEIREEEIKTTSNEEPKKFGNPEINELIDFLTEEIGSPPDGTKQSNRNMASNLLKKVKKNWPDRNAVVSIKEIIHRARGSDQWISQNAVNYTWIYRNFNKMIQTIKNGKPNKNNPGSLAEEAMRHLFDNNGLS